MIDVRSAEVALVELLAALDAERWDDVALRLDPSVQLADELTVSWLRGTEAVSRYLHAQSGIVTDIASTPSSLAAQLIGVTHAMVTFNLRQHYRLDGDERRETLTGCAIFNFAGSTPLLLLLHLGTSGGIETEDAAEEPAGEAESTGQAAEFNLGEEIRTRREAAGLSLRAFGERTGLSASLISQVERSLTDPSVSSLRRIAEGLGVGTSALLGFQRRQPTGHRPGRPDDRARIFLGEAGMTIDAFPALPESRLEAYIAELAPESVQAPVRRSHSGEEFVYVLDGGMDLCFEDGTTVLGPGDGAHISSDSPHNISPRGKLPLRYLTVQHRESR